MTKVTRDVSDYTIRPITDIIIDGSGSSSIDGVPIGQNNAAPGAFTNTTTSQLTVTTSATFTGAIITGLASYYADIAEYYQSDMKLEPGDVVSIGGNREITLCVGEMKAFGIISTNPAFEMNKTGLKNHYPVVMTGRTPCKVTGKIGKGDSLYSSGNGTLSTVINGPVIARSLEETTTSGVINVVTRIVL